MINTGVTPGIPKQAVHLPSLNAFKKLQSHRKESQLRPHIADMYATIYVAITVIIMAYSGLFGIYPTLLFYALWLPRIFYKGRFILMPAKDITYSLILPVFCCFSVLWSLYPSISIYAGIEFVSMIICTLIIARLVSINASVKGFIIGSCFVLIATLINGTYGRDPFNGTYALIGLFGSKNQVGFFAEIGILCSILVLFTKNRFLSKVVFAFFPLIFFLVCLYLSRSASSYVSLIIVLTISVFVYFMNKFPKRYRRLTAGIGLIVAIILIGLSLDLNIYHEILRMLGKDSTLTGRTYLWAEGVKAGLNFPVLGYGYNAFWVPGQPLAENYWYQFFIPQRMGFHFHNLFIQTFVDLGSVGLFIMTILILANCYQTLLTILKSGMTLEATFLLMAAFLSLTRAFVEVDFLGPFGIGTLLFFSILPRLTIYQKTLRIHSSSQ